MTLKELCLVMAGLDPAIHLLKIDGYGGIQAKTRFALWPAYDD
jgi:hypothetical protein